MSKPAHKRKHQRIPALIEGVAFKANQTHPFFNVRGLKVLDAKKPVLEPIHRRYSKINTARRRYALGDDSAFEET